MLQKHFSRWRQNQGCFDVHFGAMAYLHIWFEVTTVGHTGENYFTIFEEL